MAWSVVVLLFAAVSLTAGSEDGLRGGDLTSRVNKRIKMDDVRYFRVLHDNRDYRRSVVNPSSVSEASDQQQLPRHPKKTSSEVEDSVPGDRGEQTRVKKNDNVSENGVQCSMV